MRIPLENNYTISIVRNPMIPQGYSVAVFITDYDITTSPELYDFGNGRTELLIYDLSELEPIISEVLDIEE